MFRGKFNAFVSCWKTRNLARNEVTPATLQLDDKSLVKLDRIIENVLVKNDMFILPAVIILEMEKDKDVLLILEKPFFATGDAWIGVKDKTIVFNFNNDKVTFDVDYAI